MSTRRPVTPLPALALAVSGMRLGKPRAAFRVYVILKDLTPSIASIET